MENQQETPSQETVTADGKRPRVSLHSVSLYVLSKESGTEEEIRDFYDTAKRLFPQYVLELTCEDHEEFSIVDAKLVKLDRENRKCNYQKHRGLILKEKELAECMEDSGRDETEYYIVIVSPLKEDEDFETINDMCSDFFNSQGIVVRENDETMEDFVRRMLSDA